MIGIALLGLLVLAIGISTMPAYASFEKHQPVLYTIDFPSSISVGQTISIPYTFSWYNSDGTPVYTESYPGEKEHFRNRIIVHISDEFTLLNEDKFHMGGQGDMYGSHFKNMYKLYVNYSENGTSGSIDLRLDKPLSYDRDIVSFGIEGSDHFDFQTQRTDDGLIFVEPESLIEQYDLDQLAFTTWHIQWIHKDYDANDINERYDWYYHSEEVHKPQTRTDLQVAPSQLEVDFYIPRSGWNDFADYLRFAIPLENIYNTRAWLLEQDASEEFVNDFLIEYPEFTKTRTSQDYSNRSSLV